MGRVASLGLNWFPLPQARVTLNALRIEKERDEERETASAVQMRFAYQFSLDAQSLGPE